MKAAKQLTALILGACGIVSAQTASRADLIDSTRTQKEANLTPETPPKVEARLESIENSLPYRLLTGDSSGFSVGFGNIVPGTGFAAGPQYTRTGLWNRRLNLTVQARASTNESYLGRLDLSLPNLFGDRVSLDFSLAHKNISEMPYYGAGPDSRKTGRSDYRLEDTNVELRPAVRLYKGLRAGLIGSYLAVNTGPGHATSFISIEEQFGPAAAPGIDRQTNFWRGGGFLEYDWRDQTSYPTSGGRYWAQYVRYLERNLGAYSFLRLDMDASQYIPLFNRTRVFALHGSSSLTTAGNGQLVPFYLQPTLGGSNTLRGYRPNRFYGDNSVMVSGEYRRFCSPTLDMAVFADAGKVFPRWERSHYPKLRRVGLFDAWSFDPLKWKPEVPNPAFLMMDSEDAFWAAKQVAAFTDAEIRALVETGEYSDPRAADWIADCPIKRRDKIAAAWFSRILPLDKFCIVGGKLTFEDLARGGAGNGRKNSITWANWDGHSRATPLPDAGSRVPALRTDAQYLKAMIKPAGNGAEGDDAVTVYLRHGRTGPELVGIDR